MLVGQLICLSDMAFREVIKVSPSQETLCDQRVVHSPPCFENAAIFGLHQALKYHSGAFRVSLGVQCTQCVGLQVRGFTCFVTNTSDFVGFVKAGDFCSLADCTALFSRLINGSSSSQLSSEDESMTCARLLGMLVSRVLVQVVEPLLQVISLCQPDSEQQRTVCTHNNVA